MDGARYQHLTINGDISVTPAGGEVNSNAWLYLLMGPTGAGKSSFVEALAGGTETLGISKDQLAGYTQCVTAYRIVNIVYDSRPVYLIDTPGFSDAKISELEIMDMVKKWMLEKRVEYFDSVLYLTPITDTRLPGTKRRTIDMLAWTLDLSQRRGSLTFVTTMWDTLYNDRTKQRAESNWKFTVTQFFNTTASALKTLDGSDTSLIAFGHAHVTKVARSIQLYQDLYERIENALQQMKNIECDLAQATSESSLELKAILMANKRENDAVLMKFIGQLADSEPPPDELVLAAQQLQKKIIAEIAPVNNDLKFIFQSWAQEGEISEHKVGPAPQSPSSHIIKPNSVHVTALKRLGHGNDSSQPPRILKLEHPIDNAEPRVPRILALKGLVRRLLKMVRQRGKKLFSQRRD